MKEGWKDRPRISKIAGAMYPSHLDPKTRDEMIRANLEQEAGLKRRMSEGDRMYGRGQRPQSWWDKQRSK
jgi:hypothetical protein